MSVHGQELRPEDTGPYREAAAGLLWLAAHEALAGVHEIIRERRRQIEQLGYDAEHDDRECPDGRLAYNATWYVSRVRDARITGTADIGSDEAGLRKAGAMLAAEIDRLNRDLTPDGPA